MRDESQNALLKTLEEPPGFVHLILISSEPAGAAGDDRLPLPAGRLRAAAGRGGRSGPGGRPGTSIAAVARISAGDVELARLLLSERGREIRAEADRDATRRPRRGAAASPGGAAKGRRGAGEDAEAAAREAPRRSRTPASSSGPRPRRPGEARRAPRPHRPLDPGLGFSAVWFRDLAATAAAPPTSPTTATAWPSSVRRRGPRSQRRPPRRRAGPGYPPAPRPQRRRGTSPRCALVPARSASLGEAACSRALRGSSARS